MTIANIVKRVNMRLKNDTYTYDDLTLALDAAIDKLNTEWRMNIPMITNYPEWSPLMKRDGTPAGDGKLILTEYTFLPDEMIRMFVVPYAAGYQYMMSDVDGSIEMQEAMVNLARLSERYQITSVEGADSLGVRNYSLLSEDYSDQFANGHDNYGYEEGREGGTLNPLGQ